MAALTKDKLIFVPGIEPVVKPQMQPHNSLLHLYEVAERYDNRVKYTLAQVTKAQRWSRGIALLFL
jgi:hypothetical protein